jgi:hypothetical protein
MNLDFTKSQISLAVTAMVGAMALASMAPLANANDALPGGKPAVGKNAGTYLAGDFHNHSTCSDGAVSMQKKVRKSMDRTEETPWGLDWFVQAGHGGTGNRNCTLAEDASLATPAYPLVYATDGTLQGPTTTWRNTNPPVTPKGDQSGSGATQNMWRWEGVQTYQYPLLEYLAAYRNEPLFMGVESVVAGHEHTSMSVITGQMPSSIYKNRRLHTTGQRQRPGQVGLLLRPWQQRHQPRQHHHPAGQRQHRRGQQLGMLGAGQPQQCEPGLECRRRQAERRER